MNRKKIILASVICAFVQTFCVHAQECLQQQAWWLQGELLYWSVRNNVPNIPFVTFASLSDPLPGALGQPGTKIALSSCSLANHFQRGFRVLTGICIDAENATDIEVSYLRLPEHVRTQTIATSGHLGSENLAVPIFDTSGVWGLSGNPGETIAILPGPLFGDPKFTGQFSLCTTSRLQEAELNGIFKVMSEQCSILQTSLGVGWLQVQESAQFNGTTATIDSTAPGFYNFHDQYTTTNNFFGLLIGAREKSWRGKAALHVAATGGLGFVRNHYCIEGSSQTNAGNLFFLTKNTGGETLCGGIFTQPSNIGTCNKFNFAGTFQATIRGSYCVFSALELSIGYNFILLSHTARAFDQIDRKINTTRTSLADASRITEGIGTGPIPFGKPGPAPAASGDCNPIRLLKTSIFWTQGLIAGVALKF